MIVNLYIYCLAKKKPMHLYIVIYFTFVLFIVVVFLTGYKQWYPKCFTSQKRHGTTILIQFQVQMFQILSTRHSVSLDVLLFLTLKLCLYTYHLKILIHFLCVSNVLLQHFLILMYLCWPEYTVSMTMQTYCKFMTFVILTFLFTMLFLF